MTEAARTVAVRTRPYRDDDQAGVLELLSDALGGGPGGKRTSEFFSWKHLDNPFGRSYLLVAEEEGRIVGLRAFMRWSFRSGNRIIRSVRAVDTATHPNHQGRGIFSRLTMEALDEVRRDTDLVFNTPNEKSLPGYLKMGWQVVGKMPISVRPRRPLRVLTGLQGRRRTAVPSGAPPTVRAETSMEALSDPGIGPLLDEAGRDGDERLTTPRTQEYLRWRFGSIPVLDYRAVREYRGETLTGIALFRARPRGRLWESTVAELIVRPGDTGTARRLLRRVADAAGSVDHLTCHFPRGTAAARAAAWTGFLRAPGGVTFVVNQLQHVPMPSGPAQPSAWALTLGDLEVF